MPGPLDGVNMMAQALRAFQRGINTAGHNLANVNTPGYSRQRVELGSSDPLRFYQGDWRFLGQGVRLESVSRARDLAVEARWREHAGHYQRASTTAQGLGALAGVYGEPTSDGVAAAFDRFFNEWSGFAANSADPTARAAVRRSGQALADRVRGAWHGLEAQAAEAARDVTATLDKVDALAARIDALNARIRQAALDPTAANDLLDQRDTTVRELAGLVDVRVSTGPGGSYNVHASGYLLVTDSGPRPMPREYDAAAGTLTADGVTYSVREGALAGHMQTIARARNEQAQLDRMANALRDAVNSIHRTGTNWKEVTNIDFFNPSSNDPYAPTGAFDLDLSDLVKESADYVVSGISGKPGDNALAQQIADLREAPLGTLDGRTIVGFYRERANALDADANAYEASAGIAASVLAQTQQQADAVSGVSLDDEMAEMVKWQRSYQAAAKALAAYDQMMDDLIGMLRR